MSAPEAVSQVGGKRVILLCAAAGVIVFARSWEHRERERFSQLAERRDVIQRLTAEAATSVATVWTDSLARFSMAPRRGETPALALVAAVEDMGRASGAEITTISIVSDSVSSKQGGLVALRFSARGNSASAIRLLRVVEEHRPLLRISELSVTQLNPLPRPGDPDEVVIEGRVEAIARPADEIGEVPHG